MEGLHTELPSTTPVCKRSRDLWWTVYTLDRQLSTSLGVPVSVQDHDISTPLYDTRNSAQEDCVLAMKVKLSQILSTVFDSKSPILSLRQGYQRGSCLLELYRPGKIIDKAFLDQTKTVLETLASISNEIQEVVDTTSTTLNVGPSKATLHLTLQYHQVSLHSPDRLTLQSFAEMWIVRHSSNATSAIICLHRMPSES